MDLENLKRYRPAIVAAKFAQEKNETGVTSSLEKLVGTLSLGEDGGDFVNVIRGSPEGNKIMMSICSRKYHTTLREAKVGNLFEFYNPYFEKFSTPETYNVAKTFFNEYKNETYEFVRNKMIKARDLIKSEQTDISEEDRKKAEKELMKYEKIILPLQKFESYELKKLEDPADEDSFRKDFAEMFKVG